MGARVRVKTRIEPNDKGPETKGIEEGRIRKTHVKEKERHKKKRKVCDELTVCSLQKLTVDGDGNLSVHESAV